jgi:hypothetical protein
LAFTTSNLGMAARQKWMVVLPLIIAMAHAWTRSHLVRGDRATSPSPLSQSSPPLGPAAQASGDR